MSFLLDPNMELCILCVCGDNFHYTNSTIEIRNLHYHYYINKIEQSGHTVIKHAWITLVMQPL